MYRLVLALAALVIPAQGAYLGYFAGAVAGPSKGSMDAIGTATSLDFLNHSDGVSSNGPDGSGASSYNLHVGFDKLGIAFSDTASWHSNRGGLFAAGANYALDSRDRLFFNVDQGFLKLDVLFDGQFIPPALTNSTAENNSFTVNFTVRIFGPGTELNYRANVLHYTPVGGPTFDVAHFPSLQGGSTAQLDPVSLIFDDASQQYSVSMMGSLFVPFSQGYLDVWQQLFGNRVCIAHVGAPSCFLSGDFLNTAAIGGAVIVDAQGKPIPGATITAQSGFDYTRTLGAPAESPIPEPSTALFMLAGLTLLLSQIRRRS